MEVVQCNCQIHSEAILAILNEAIANFTALYGYKRRTVEVTAGCVDAKRKGGNDTALRMAGFYTCFSIEMSGDTRVGRKLKSSQYRFHSLRCHRMA